MAELIVKLDLNDIKELIVAHLNEVYQLENAKVEDIEVYLENDDNGDDDDNDVKNLVALYKHTS